MKKIKTASTADLRAAITERKINSTKRSNGRILVVGGSKDFHGAPVLASNAAYETLAALRVGIGYAVICVPSRVADDVRRLSPNLIVKSLDGEIISEKHLRMLQTETEKADILVVGMGLGRDKRTLRTISKLISFAANSGKRVIVDADAIRSLKSAKLNLDVLITPNESEFSFLQKEKSKKSDLDSRIIASVKLSKRLGAVVLLKGHQTIVTNGTITKVIKAKSAVLATMGTGDVLSGIIGGLAARNPDLFKCAVAGAFLHASIGDMLYKDKGAHILASDVVEYIPKAFRKLVK